MQKINPSRLTLRLQFGHYEGKANQNGIIVNTFVNDDEVWGGVFHTSLTQQYLLMGNEQTDLHSFVVRHNQTLQQYKVLSVNGQLYDHLTFNTDGLNNHHDFDIVIAKKVVKNG